MTTIWGLDLGTKCGWAVWQGGQRGGAVTRAGTLLLKKPQEPAATRWWRMEGLLDGLWVPGPGALAPRVTAIAYEEVRRHMGTTAAHVYGGLVAILQRWCEQAGLPEPMGVSVGTIKKRATGSGRASKEEMLAAARAEWPGLVVPNYDAADACWVAQTAAELWEPEEELLAA